MDFRISLYQSLRIELVILKNLNWLIETYKKKLLSLKKMPIDSLHN